MASAPQPLVVIVGPTASGKTALALELAERYHGEIICADSRTVYKDMDIGTAKPTADEQRRVRHHLIDVVAPGQAFSAALFQQLAKQAISEIRERKNIPFLVGGTGLYIDSILFDYQFLSQRFDVHRRQFLETLTVRELVDYCHKNNITLPENHQNKRYVIRAIEQGGVNQRRRPQPIDNSVVVGIATEKDILKQRIIQRAEQLFQDNVVEEAINIGEKYGWKSEAMTGNIYRLAGDIRSGKLSVAQAKQRFVTLDWQLAKRQLTWFHRNPFIHWGTPEEVKRYVEAYLKDH